MIDSKQEIINCIESSNDRLRALRAMRDIGLSDCFIAARFVRNAVWDRLYPMLNILLFSVVGCFSYAANSYAAGEADSAAQNISIVSLLSVPKAHDSKFVRIKGAAKFNEGIALICLRINDVLHDVSENCLSLEIVSGLVKPSVLSEWYSEKYILVEGVFRKPSNLEPSRIENEDGTVTQYSYWGLPLGGAIVKVNRIEVWSHKQ